MTGSLSRYLSELAAAPALTGQILDTLPPLPRGGEPVIVRVRPEYVDRGTARAIALAVEGVLATVELIQEEQ
jgi:hypothetical protein